MSCLPFIVFSAQNTPRFSLNLASGVVEPTHVPGLNLTNRSGGYQGNQPSIQTGYQGNGYPGNESYVENRTLTPSKHRQPTARSEPDLVSISARKEFGTQTGEFDHPSPIGSHHRSSIAKRLFDVYLVI